MIARTLFVRNVYDCSHLSSVPDSTLDLMMCDRKLAGRRFPWTPSAMKSSSADGNTAKEAGRLCGEDKACSGSSVRAEGEESPCGGRGAVTLRGFTDGCCGGTFQPHGAKILLTLHFTLLKSVDRSAGSCPRQLILLHVSIRPVQPNATHSKPATDFPPAPTKALSPGL